MKYLISDLISIPFEIARLVLEGAIYLIGCARLCIISAIKDRGVYILSKNLVDLDMRIAIKNVKFFIKHFGKKYSD